MTAMTGAELGEKLLHSVRQMKRNDAARTTQVELTGAAQARTDGSFAISVRGVAGRLATDPARLGARQTRTCGRSESPAPHRGFAPSRVARTRHIGRAVCGQIDRFWEVTAHGEIRIRIPFNQALIPDPQTRTCSHSFGLRDGGHFCASQGKEERGALPAPRDHRARGAFPITPFGVTRALSRW